MELLTVKELGEFLKIGRSKAYFLIKQKDFPIIKIGKNIRINKDNLLNWLNEKNIII